MTTAPQSSPPHASGPIVITKSGATALEITSIRTSPLAATLQPVGELDSSNSELLRAVVNAEIRHGARMLRLDLSRLTFCDCAGLRAIEHSHQRLQTLGGTLTLTGLPGHIRRLLAITGLDNALIVKTTPRAVRPVPRSHNGLRRAKT